jgi:hypothetical protein
LLLHLYLVAFGMAISMRDLQLTVHLQDLHLVFVVQVAQLLRVDLVRQLVQLVQLALLVLALVDSAAVRVLLELFPKLMAQQSQLL